MAIESKLLIGKRVLIVEDEWLVSLYEVDFLVEFGCIPVGPFSTVKEALNAVRCETFDVAMLDINIQGELVYPVAEVLVKSQIPFLFVSGYGDGIDFPVGRPPTWDICPKPFTMNDLSNKLLIVLNYVA
jgi:DNA-binding response OmpR family regulator